MKKIVRIKFGSHLYGTATPQSDVDFKGVYLPSGQDILLQRVRNSISSKPQKAAGEKNRPGEVDEDMYSLHRYLELVAQGQTVALDMLFAPEWAMTDDPHPAWVELSENRDKLLTKKAGAFLGYCRQQANKYGIKGSRVAAARSALELLASVTFGKSGSLRAPLGDNAKEIEDLVSKTDHMSILEIQNASGAIVRHWEVCGRKMPFTASVSNAAEVLDRLVAEYGNRALAAESQQGVDWKALSHAVRVGRQALELMETGVYTFPLPYADHILRIKRGEIAYQEVADEIELLLEEIEEAAQTSVLPDEPDQQWIDNYVASWYRTAVLS